MLPYVPGKIPSLQKYRGGCLGVSRVTFCLFPFFFQAARAPREVFRAVTCCQRGAGARGGCLTPPHRPHPLPLASGARPSEHLGVPHPHRLIRIRGTAPPSWDSAPAPSRRQHNDRAGGGGKGSTPPMNRNLREKKKLAMPSYRAAFE